MEVTKGDTLIGDIGPLVVMKQLGHVVQDLGGRERRQKRGQRVDKSACLKLMVPVLYSLVRTRGVEPP